MPRGLILSEAADKKVVEVMQQAINSPLGIIETVELLTMRLAPKQILVNARVNLKNNLTNEQIAQTIGEIKAKIKEVKPKVDMILL